METLTKLSKVESLSKEFLFINLKSYYRYKENKPSQQKMNIENLPPEMMIKIFKVLEPLNLKNIALVCKRWKNISDSSGLWSWSRLNLGDLSSLVKLNMKRAEHIENICLEECDIKDLNQILKSIENMPKIKIITGLDHKNLSLIEPYLLARVVNKVEEVDWCFHTRMTTLQAQAILEKMAKETKLKELQMVNKCLVYIQPEVLGSAVNNVESVYMSDTNHGHMFPPDQVRGIFTAISSGTNVKTFMLRDIDISLVEPSTMASALNKLEEVMIWKSFRPSSQADLSEAQCKALFNNMSKKTNLKKMVITTEYMNKVNPRIFAEALNNLEEASVYDKITNIQATAFFSMMAEKTSLQKFRIFNTNLSAILPSIMGKGIMYLEELTMVGCRLTSEQTLSIFLSINEGNSLKKLNLSHSDLSNVDRELLVIVSKKLEKITINNNHLSYEQIISILKPCAEKQTKLNTLILRNTKLTDIEPELLSKALRNLYNIELNDCSLRPAQVNMILEDNTTDDSNLEDLTIINEDLDQLEIGLLEEAASIYNVSYAV